MDVGTGDTIDSARQTRGAAYARVVGAATRMLALAALTTLGGCCTVTVYEPLKGLQRPTAVDVQGVQLAGTRVLVSCRTGKDMPASDADRVCRNLARLLEQQGAQVETQVPRADDVVDVPFEGQGADLTLELQSEIVHAFDYPALAVFSVMTCTLLPAVEEHTYAHEVTVRGRDGSVLITDSLRARFVDYTGCGVWSLNWVVDMLFRAEADRLTGDAPKKDFSQDFYRQLSQLAFHARVRSDVLGLTTRPARVRVAAPVMPAPTPTSAPTTPTTSAPTTSAPTTTTPTTTSAPTPPPAAPPAPLPAPLSEPLPSLLELPPLPPTPAGDPY